MSGKKPTPQEVGVGHVPEDMKPFGGYSVCDECPECGTTVEIPVTDRLEESLRRILGGGD